MTRQTNNIQSNNWCTRCKISEYATTQPAYRGDENPDVLLIGEAPGFTEDNIGQPFVGQAGKLLDEAIRDAGWTIRYGMTNLIRCRPCDRPGGPNRTPHPWEIERCRDHLMDEIARRSPRVLVLLGRTAQNSGIEFDGPIYELPHPAFVLRAGNRTYKEFVQRLIEIEEDIRNDTMDDK